MYNKDDNNYTLTVAEEDSNDSEDFVEYNSQAEVAPKVEQSAEEYNDNPFNF